MKLHEEESVRGGGIARGDERADLIGRIERRCESNPQTVHGDTAVDHYEQSIFGYILQHSNAAPAEFGDRFWRKRAVELQ